MGFFQAIKAINNKLQVGIANAVIPCYPLHDQDKVAAKLVYDYYVGAYLDPLFKGIYPDNFRYAQETNNPDYKLEDLQIIKQPLDFLGVNAYTRFVVTSNGEQIQMVQAQYSGVKFTDMNWEIYPQGMYDLLVQLSADYNNPNIYIMENGAAFKDVVEAGQVHDEQRTAYYQEYLAMVAKAIEAGCKIKGYFAWSLFDNFEWAHGLEKRFGLVHVNYETQERIIKDSGRWYGKLSETNQRNWEWTIKFY